jgi:hypothetical protein
MATSNRQPKWDIYEAAILLDGYLETLQKKHPRKHIIGRISLDLREMAVNRGMIIDDVFRNENGISYQLQSMDSAYVGHTVFVPATKLSKEIISIFRNDHDKYAEILEDAKKMISAKQNNRVAFFTWAESSLPSKRIKWLEDNILRVEKQGLSQKIITGSVFDITDVHTLEMLVTKVCKSKIFRVKYKKIYDAIIDDFSAYIYFCSQLETPEQMDADEEDDIYDSVLPTSISIESEPDILQVDFDNIANMAYSKPYSVAYCGKKLSAPTSWKNVYTSVIAELYADYPRTFDGLISPHGGVRVEFCRDENVAKSMVRAKKVSNQLYAETNFSATDLVKRIKMLLEKCDVDFSSVVIQYTNGNSQTEEFTPENNDTDIAAHEATFLLYLRKHTGLAEKTCSSYVSSVRSAELYAIGHNYSHCNLFRGTRDDVIATVSELYRDPSFLRYNEQQHHRFSAALNKLLESIGANVPGKYTMSFFSPEPEAKEVQTSNSAIVSVLKAHYEYGFKCGSLRELMRFRQFAEGMDVSVPEDNEQLASEILAAGTVIDDKVYVKSESLPIELQNIIAEIADTGVGVIYYERLMYVKSEWMESHVITSEEMLKEYLQKYIRGWSFSKKFMAKAPKRTEKDAVTEEIKRIWGDCSSVSVDELSERLPYIPQKNIWRVISGNNHFVLASEGVYLYLELFHISDDDIEAILDFVESSCNEKGFASLSELPVENIEEENYELTRSTILNAIYKKVLMCKYYLNGKILTKGSPELDAVTLLKQDIKNRDECTFDEVADKVVELTGVSNRQYAFQALYDEMVRVDKNRFVANQSVNFMVDAIDKILSSFIREHFCAIKDITTFAMFPVCGQSWNHYLLESYCYKYSKKYSLHVLHFNDKNAGIIAEKDFDKKYIEMLAIAVSRADVKLSPDTIGQYLFDAGYMAKSKYGRLDEIAQQAEKLRNER